ncbi:protein MODIFIER OF SNC1 1-like [Canna indica]|uniref:Protein MODIFIER OF SNC1 1-like n=1 Tax=Canna indica TaxID=4628 RepID=A0AAQ3JSK8_9LILI|nr:protein MODIFIER OF SNC1 1-like [Canna indica]
MRIPCVYEKVPSHGDRPLNTVYVGFACMTILGKVPKPINLPSQRGTLTWGSRPSSSSSNAWGSATLLSPKTDGSTGSPSHYSGRPSSGGSGTRPSTAGSDRSQDPSPNAWGSNSRPSTASVLLPSNQAPVLAARPRSAETRPMVTRPRSAETRPGSSQLSRFAENSGEHAVAWGTSRTAEKLGVTSSKTDEFSLSSGDFPTLGSDKKSVPPSLQGHSSQGHFDAPSDPLGPNEKLEHSLSGDGYVVCGNDGALITLRNSYDDDERASLNKELQNNQHQAQTYKSLKMTSHHFDSLHSSSVRPPDGVWYGGAIGGSPYQSAGPPGSFPVDRFVCYPCQFPPNSEAVPRPGVGPSHYQPTNGETYRPQVLHNSYIFPTHPVIPVRPGPYQTPVPYEGYHGYHKASFYNSGEQQIPSGGVATQPSSYNQHPKQTGNSTTVEFQNGPGGDDKQMAERQISCSRAHVPCQGPFKVLLKPHAGTEDNHSKEKIHYGSSTSHSDVEQKPGGSIFKVGEQSTSIRKNEMAKLGNFTTDNQLPSKIATVGECQLSNPVSTNSNENLCKTSEGILKRAPDIATPVINDQKNNSIVRKNAALIEKIEGLNNKIRSCDSLTTTGEAPVRQERSKQPNGVNTKPERSTKSPLCNAPLTENLSTSRIMDMSASESKTVTVSSESKDSILMKPDPLKLAESVSHVSKRTRAAQNRSDYYSTLGTDNQAVHGWTRESSRRDCSDVRTEKTVIGEAILSSSSDSLDHMAERTKLKEMAAQRAKQLQKEEEERTREQKAKALAKLEELNRRSAAQVMKQKPNDALSPRNSVQHQDDSGVDNSSGNNVVVANPPGDDLVKNTDSSLQPNTDSSRTSLSQDSESPIVMPLQMHHETNTTEVITEEVSSQSYVTSGSKHKQMGYRRRQKAPSEKSSGERSIMVENTSSKHQDEVVHERNPDEKPVTGEKKEISGNVVDANTLASNSNIMLHSGDPSLQHKKKNSRNARNKNKDEALMGSGLSSSAHSHENVEDHPSESSKPHPTSSVTEISSAPVQVSSNNTKSQYTGDSLVEPHQRPSKNVEEAHSRMNNHWKPQSSRRPTRNQQVNRAMDKVYGGETVIWAPIKPSNKNEQSEEVNQTSTVGSNSQSPQRIEHDMQSGTRTKRAEMERYVPKPVAKELLQQENTLKPSNYDNQSTLGDMPEKSYTDSKGSEMGKSDGSSVGRTDFIADTKNGEDSKHSRRGRAHASWRKRDSSESTLHLPSSTESWNFSDSTKLSNKPSDQHPPLPEQLRSDGWESSSNYVPKDSVVSPALTKDQVVLSRQKRHQAHSVVGSNYGNPDGRNDKSDVASGTLDMNETDMRNSIKGDNKNAVGEHIKPHSHWKPKSQTYFHNQQQSRENGGQRHISHDVRPEKFTSSFQSSHSSNENNSTLTQKDVSHAVREAGHEDSTGVEMGAFNSDLANEQMHGPKPVLQTNTSLPPGDINAQHENQVPPQRRHGNRGGRFNRGQETAYRSREMGQFPGKSSAQINEDQRKNNPHFGYQPVGSFNKPSNLYQLHSNIDQDTQGHHTRQRYKERIQTQTRNPGRFVRRNSGATAHVDDSHKSEE